MHAYMRFQALITLVGGNLMLSFSGKASFASYGTNNRAPCWSTRAYTIMRYKRSIRLRFFCPNSTVTFTPSSR